MDGRPIFIDSDHTGTSELAHAIDASDHASTGGAKPRPYGNAAVSKCGHYTANSNNGASKPCPSAITTTNANKPAVVKCANTAITGN
jgi:hypothetical protein